MKQGYLFAKIRMGKIMDLVTGILAEQYSAAAYAPKGVKLGGPGFLHSAG